MSKPSAEQLGEAMERGRIEAAEITARVAGHPAPDEVITRQIGRAEREEVTALLAAEAACALRTALVEWRDRRTDRTEQSP